MTRERKDLQLFLFRATLLLSPFTLSASWLTDLKQQRPSITMTNGERIVDAQSIGCCFGQLLHTHKQRRHKVTSVRVRVRLCVCKVSRNFTLFFIDRSQSGTFSIDECDFFVHISLASSRMLSWAEFVSRSSRKLKQHTESERRRRALFHLHQTNKQTNNRLTDWLVFFHFSFMWVWKWVQLRACDCSTWPHTKHDKHDDDFGAATNCFEARQKHKVGGNWIEFAAHTRFACSWLARARKTLGYSLISTKRVLLVAVVAVALDRSKTKTKAHFHWLIIVNREQLAHAVRLLLSNREKKSWISFVFSFQAQKNMTNWQKTEKSCCCCCRQMIIILCRWIKAKSERKSGSRLSEWVFWAINIKTSWEGKKLSASNIAHSQRCPASFVRSLAAHYQASALVFFPASNDDARWPTAAAHTHTKHTASWVQWTE